MLPAVQPETAYQSPLPIADQHLEAALRWLRALLAWRIALTRATYGALADDAYRGLYITDEEADLLSADWPPIPSNLAQQRAELARERQALDTYSSLSGGWQALRHIGQLFGLSVFERDVLLLALASEIDQRYERLYAYIQDDVTRKRPSVAMALHLLCLTPEDQLAARRAFMPGAPLIRHHLIQLLDDGPRNGLLSTSPLLARFIKLDERIVATLLAHAAGPADSIDTFDAPAVDPVIAASVAYTQPARQFDTLVFPSDLVERLIHICAGHSDGLVLALQGTYGSGRRSIAEALCTSLGKTLLTVDVSRLLESDLRPIEATQRVLREALLRNAVLLWLGIDPVLHGDEQTEWRLALLKALDEHRGQSILATGHGWEARGMLRRTYYMRVELPPLSYAGREQIWRYRLGADAPDDATIQALASTFRLTGGQIRDAAAMARSLARWRGPGSHPAAADLYAACRAQSSGRLDSLAHKINATYAWNDIVLPPDQLLQLQEICIQVRHRRTVLERWGFDRRLAMGKGVNVLFAGQSGTGKTMAAEIIASDLGLELYKVDLSTMVSKYIGETEKNLDRIFAAAREANAILFFDEADAIFGKRSEVKDAHDRYANIEVGYLLQKMEEYDGVVILATNLRKNLDDAFIRRLHVAIDFPFPEDVDRLRIWQKVFPPEAPLTEDVDFTFLARQFKISGGNIRNVALLSAFLAAEDGMEISMTHIIRATKREYQKLGKLITNSDFGPFLNANKSSA